MFTVYAIIALRCILGAVVLFVVGWFLFNLPAWGSTFAFMAESAGFHVPQGFCVGVFTMTITALIIIFVVCLQDRSNKRRERTPSLSEEGEERTPSLSEEGEESTPFLSGDGEESTSPLPEPEVSERPRRSLFDHFDQFVSEEED